MNKINAQTENEKKKAFLIKLFIILVVLLLSVIIVVGIINQNLNQKELDYGNLKTVEEVLNYYKCKFISENDSILEDFHKDIRLVFCKKLYDGDTSNEEFFNNVINDIARVTNYCDFRLIDEENDIEIKVICIDRKISNIIINDIENYFIYMDSQIDLKKYVEIKETEFQIESIEIQNLINNNWSSQFQFGTRESIFESYYEYFDEGISTRTISGKIYNIIFDKRYSKNVVNGIFPGVEIDAIERKLGEPTFEDEKLGLVGYKGKDIYVFFTNDEISIYRVSDASTDEFFELADKLLSEELDLLDFMNELTDLWPDYSDYDYDKSSVFLSYPLKGIDVQIGYENTNAIVLYNNINANMSNINRYIQNAEFVSRLRLDNVFEAEKRRVTEITNLSTKCDEYIENLEDDEKELIGESLRFETYAVLDVNDRIIKLCFVSKDGNNPNRELYDSISSFMWIDSDTIIYSQTGVGIYSYNVVTGRKISQIKGDESYNLKSFENGILKYDNSELIIQY